MATNKKLFRSRLSFILMTVAAIFLAGCRPPGPRALLAGKRLVDQGRYPEAVTKLSLAAELMPTNAPAWNYFGIALQHTGQVEKAAQAYDRALRLDKDFLAVRYNLGCLLFEQNQFERAKNEFTALTLRQPTWLDGWLRLGAAQLRTRDLAGADKSFHEALRLSPENAEALNNLGLIQWQAGRQRDALTFFTNAVAKQPNYAPARLNLAIACQASESTRRTALVHYRQYLALKPKPANWDAVNTIARQLDLELNPPRPSATVQPVVTPTPTPAPVVAKPPVSNPSRTVTPERPVAAVESPKSAPPRPASTTLDPAPPIKPDVVQVPQAIVVKPADSAPVAKPVATPPKVETPAPPPIVIPTTLPPGPRYTYNKPAAPAAGNRAEAERLIAQGMSFQRNQRPKDAVTFYRAATQADPSYFDAQAGLASISADLNDLPLSLFSFETALAINPASFTARFNFAKALTKANYPQDAAQELERLLAAQSTETPARLATAHLALANLYAERFHRPEFARPHYLKVLELDPKNSEATAIRYWLNENP